MQSKNMNPWLQIWTSPKKTMRYLLDTHSKRAVLWLAIIGGITSTPLALFWLDGSLIQEQSILLLTLFFLVGGAIYGLLYLYIGGWLLQFTGSWLGGEGSYEEVKCAVGWNYYPGILANIASFLNIISVPNPWLQGLFGLVGAVVSIWGFIIFMNLIGEAHRFSAWRALLTFFIALVLIFVAILLISLIIPLISPLFSSIGIILF